MAFALSLLTLGVDNLQRSIEFYQELVRRLMKGEGSDSIAFSEPPDRGWPAIRWTG